MLENDQILPVRSQMEMEVPLQFFKMGAKNWLEISYG